MLDTNQLLERMRRTKVVVVVRGSRTNGICALAGELAAFGLDVHEITMTTPGALACIEELRSRNPDLIVGAGTVLDAATARAALTAGAQFIVSPMLDRDVIAVAKEGSALAIPGSLTPSEAIEASRAGADIVKVFPASLGGPGYIRALKGPLPDLRFLPTGGITVDNAVDFLDAGSFAVCLGTSFLQPSALESGEYAETLESASQLMNQLRARAQTSESTGS